MHLFLYLVFICPFFPFSSGVGETAGQQHSLAPSVLPLLILLTATAKNKINKIRVPETSVGLTSYLFCSSPGAIALHKMEVIYKLVA